MQEFNVDVLEKSLFYKFKNKYLTSVIKIQISNQFFTFQIEISSW